MAQTRIRLGVGLLAACFSVLTRHRWAQVPKSAAVAPAPSTSVVSIEQPDANAPATSCRASWIATPRLRSVLALDPALLAISPISRRIPPWSAS